MASLTPGVLSKLLENKDAKVTGDHRSALLQIIEILPSLSSGDDPWRSRGFFLKVSDSLHAAYVSISDHDSDMIYAGDIQLGQFVYATRLDSASPVPILRGLKLVPKRKPCPCIGNPVDLVPSDLLFAKKPSTKSGNNGGGGARARRSSVSGDDKGLVEMRRLSLDSAVRRACWDDQKKKPLTKNDSISYKPLGKYDGISQKPLGKNDGISQKNGSRFKSKQSTPVSVISEKEASPKNIPSLKHPNLNTSPLKNKNDTVSPVLTKRPLRTELKSSSDWPTPSRLVKVPLDCKTGSGQKISWNALPATITELGKQAVHHRNISFLAAVRSLEEASAADGVIHCMCVFAELCELPQKSSAGAVVQKFLDLNQTMQCAATVVDSLLNSRLPGADSTNYCPQRHLSPDSCKDSISKNAASWIKAALATNLSAFDVFRKQKDELPNGEKCHYVVLEKSPAEDFENRSPASKQNKRNSGTLLSDSTTKLSPPASGRLSSTARRSSIEKDDSSKGSRLTEAASLSAKLLMASREWFLKYLEDYLNTGFGLKGEERGPEVTSLLGQLKRVNHWLDELALNGAREDKRIGLLKKKLYGFLLEHVNSAVLTSQ